MGVPLKMLKTDIWVTYLVCVALQGYGPAREPVWEDPEILFARPPAPRGSQPPSVQSAMVMVPTMGRASGHPVRILRSA